MPADICNANWFASNLVRKYPLDSTSSCIDMNGNYLPDMILTDIQLSYPYELGEYCYVAAVNITEKLVSIVFCVESTPIASLCVSRPVDEGRYYAVDALQDGVRGVVTLGVPASMEPGKWVFNDTTSSRILPTCCNPYKPAPVNSLSRPNDTDPLTGNVLLTAGNDMLLETADVYIAGKKTKIILVGLDTFTDRDEVLKSYLSLCDVNTEMNTCSRRYVSAIGGATPDCSGNITIEGDEDGTIEVVNNIGDGIILVKSNRTLDKVCRNSSPFSLLEDGEGKTKCPFPTIRSDDICPGRGAGEGSSYPPDTDDFTYMDLRKDDLSVTRGGLVYDACTDGSISPASESEPTFFNITVPDNISKLQVAFKYTGFDDYSRPLGALHIICGYHRITIDDYGQVAVQASGPNGEFFAKNYGQLLSGVETASVNFTLNKMYLYMMNTEYKLTDIFAQLVVSNKVEFTLDGPICIESIRYV